MVKISELFDVTYGVNLELNKLTEDENGINFVSRTAQNNGVSARVLRLPHVNPIPAGTISVAAGGSVLATFLQPEPYYSGRDLYYLKSKTGLSDQEKLYYCMCIRANKYRYSYGRQANRTLKNLLVPSPSEIPQWVFSKTIPDLKDFSASLDKHTLALETNTWKYVELQEIFNIKKGKRITKANMIPGATPFIAAIDSNNGIRQFISQKPQHDGNTITVNYNGSVAEAFYQSIPFCASDDVNVLYPRFPMNKYVALFIIAAIQLEKYRFNYGRKWHLARMKRSQIKIPVNCNGEIDTEYMESYIKTCAFSSSL